MPPPKLMRNRVASRVIWVLQRAAYETGSSEVYAEAGYILSRDPITIRQPDVSMVNKDRIGASDEYAYLEGAPELAIEVVSPSDSAEDLQVKVDQYLKAGAKQVWVIYPRSKQVYVFHAAGASAVLDETQTLEGGALLPEFSVKVADLFVSENRANAE